jgi:HK97 family phage major capsid protein
MIDKLKESRERRSELLGKMDGLIKKAEGEKRSLTDTEQKEFDGFDTEIDGLDKEIPRLEKMEARQKEIALENARIAKEKAILEGRSDPAADPVDAKVKATQDRLKTDEARNVNTFKLIKSHMGKNSVGVEEARKALADGGHYDDLLTGPNGEKRGFNTLIDTDGGILLPSSITSTVMDIMQGYGVIPRLALNLGDISQSNVKIPQILGRPTFSAISQGGTITGSGFGLGAIELKAQKWATIINWTNEVSDSVAARLMPIIMDKTAEAFAFAQDNVFCNGTGTSAYNNIKGLEGLTGTVNYVRTAAAVSGNVSFATLDADDFLTPQLNVAPGTRAGSVYLMHPNQIFTLRKLKDNQGKYIYGDPSAIAPAGTLWGYPIETSEAFAYTDGTSKTVCAFFNPKYVAYATGRNLSADELREGSITDEDGNTQNLATTDGKALRFTGLFDLMLSSVTRTTAGTAQGAFSVLRTSAS